jgi:hypothetical protein
MLDSGPSYSDDPSAESVVPTSPTPSSPTPSSPPHAATEAKKSGNSNTRDRWLDIMSVSF